MKTQLALIISLLLLFISCAVDPQFSYDGIIGNVGKCTVRVRMPDRWEIVNVQLNTEELVLEYDRGIGVEKQHFPLICRFVANDESLQFRGANRIEGLSLLHFTNEEDPQSVFNPPLAKTSINEGLKVREVFAIFRTSNWLTVHYSIENTSFGNLISHDLRQHYFKKAKIAPGNRINLEVIDDVLHFKIALNNKVKRSFPIQKFVSPNEDFWDSGGGSNVRDNLLSWTENYKIIPKLKKD